jgi:hypothetical protein
VLREPVPAVRLTIAGRPRECSTLLGYAGAYQLTLSTTVEELGVELHSSYLGHPDAHTTIAAHLQLAPGRTPHVTSVEHPSDELPVRDLRARCLLDHLHQLSALLADDADGEVLLDVNDRALELVEHS